MGGTPRQLPVLAVLPPRALLLDVAGPMEALRVANRVQERVRFDVSYAAPRPVTRSSVGLTLGGAVPLPERVEDGTIVVLASAASPPGPGPDAEADARDEAAIVAWLRRVIRPRLLLVCVCDGALLAARAGLLDGHSCTTHRASCGRLAALAPAARVLENRLFVRDGERLTSAGGTAGVDLMLHLVAELTGPEAALAVARSLVVFLRRGPDDPQLSPWLEGRNHLHPVVHRVQDALAADPARPWSLAALAAVARTSPRTPSRLFNAHAGMTVSEAVGRARVMRARELLAGDGLGVEAAAERAGFGSSRHLRRVWARFHPTPPGRARGA